AASGGWITGSTAFLQRRISMFVFGVVFLALFSAISYVLGNEDSRREPRPSDDLGYWAFFGHR
ncbi:MAG TPA: hypothetical protein VID95_04910, partial [Candidatus Limnocylindrales bacterium]